MNRIYQITSAEAKKITAEAAAKKIFVAELYGKKIKTRDEFLDAVSKEFRYPELFKKYRNYNAHEDWIRDLSWITYGSDYRGFALIVYDYKDMFGDDYKEKERFLYSFSVLVLPWWEEDIKTCSAGSEPKEFNLYLVL